MPHTYLTDCFFFACGERKKKKDAMEFCSASGEKDTHNIIVFASAAKTVTRLETRIVLRTILLRASDPNVAHQVRLRTRATWRAQPAITTSYLKTNVLHVWEGQIMMMFPRFNLRDRTGVQVYHIPKRGLASTFDVFR